ncbi:MAG TPA: sugar kinase [Candidatus Limnocylindrales bacterium]|nr:sugar kinase [Candidatus Limnocylindrales bacterium]
MAIRVVGLGEAMIRFTPSSPVRLEQAQEFRATVGGTELNALVLLARLGFEAVWVTRLPANPLGRLIAAHAQSHGVSLAVEWDERARAGLYFVEMGASPRPSQVIYDRAHSAMSLLQAGRIDWTTLLSRAACLHVTGITPALGKGPREAVHEALAAARTAGVLTSLDVNYRSRLWPLAEAKRSLGESLPLVDLLFATRFDLEELLDAPGEPGEAAARVRERYGMRAVVVPDRHDLGPGRVGVTVLAVTDGDTAESDCQEADVVDPLGAGDAIAAAFLSVQLRGGPLTEAVQLAARAGALKHTVQGDVLLVDRDELDPAFGSGRRILR